MLTDVLQGACFLSFFQLFFEYTPSSAIAGDDGLAQRKEINRRVAGGKRLLSESHIDIAVISQLVVELLKPSMPVRREGYHLAQERILQRRPDRLAKFSGSNIR